MEKLENRISSREVAEMMEVRHGDLVRKIDKINKDFTESKIAFSKYWILSNYKDASGKENREYQVTKRGCEFLAHKTTGTKGNLFTNKYMDRFEQMKEYIEENNKPQLPNDYLSALKALVASEEEKQRLEKENKVLAPKAEGYDTFLNKEGLITLGDLAKFLGYGRNKFMEMLRSNKILMSSNIPYQNFMKYFEIKVTTKNGKEYKSSLANKSGIDYLSRKFKKEK